MVVDCQLAYHAVKLVLQKHEAEHTVTSSLECGMITGISTLGASLLLGPIGIVAGAAIGSIIAYAKHRGQFKPLREVFEKDLSEEERKIILEKVKEFLSKLTVEDGVVVLNLLLSNQSSSVLFNLVQEAIYHLITKRSEKQSQLSRAEKQTQLSRAEKQTQLSRAEKQTQLSRAEKQTQLSRAEKQTC